MIGRFTERIVIQQSSKASDGAFGYTESWNTVTDVWASVTPLEQVYGLEANQPVSTERYVLRTHYRTDFEFTPLMRGLWKGNRQFIFEGIRVINQRYMMVEITATLVQGAYEELPDNNNAFPYTFPLTLG